MITIILIIIILILSLCNNFEYFKNCGPSAPNVQPPDWYVPENMNIKNWTTRMYPDRGSIEKNANSVAYRFWQY